MIGDAAPLSENVKPSDELPLFRISSDVEPLPELYALNVKEAVTNGKPSIIAFATPGLCTNTICTPVLNATIKPLYEQFGDQVNVLHVEVYNLQTSAYVPAMDEWGLSYEPWTYVVDAQGIVTARFDGPVAVSEITPAIEAALSN